MSRPQTSKQNIIKPINDADGKISSSQLDSFFDGVSNKKTNEKITINVNVDETLSKGKSIKTLKTEIDMDGELIRHESLMTEMDVDDGDDDANIELLKTLINDDNDDDIIGGNLLDNLSDGYHSDQMNKSIEKVDIDDENMLILKNNNQINENNIDNDNEKD